MGTTSLNEFSSKKNSNSNNNNNLVRLLAKWTGISFLRKKFRTWKNRRVLTEGRKQNSSSLYVLANTELEYENNSSLQAHCKMGEELSVSMGNLHLRSEMQECSVTEGEGKGQNILLLSNILMDDLSARNAIRELAEQQYSIQRTIGIGSFSKVKLAYDRHNGRQVAIKLISIEDLTASPRLRETLFKEIEILKSVKHQNIATFTHYTFIKNSVGLVMEYIPGVELFHYVTECRRLSEGETRTIIHQLLSALSYLHDRGIAHRDLKLENILILKSANGTFVKLIDFGLAALAGLNLCMLSTRCGSEEYAAPEVIMGRPYDGRKSDMWSVGVILYACLVGSLPFNADAHKPRSLAQAIVSGIYSIPDGLLSVESISLLRGLLVVDPVNRYSVSEALNHEFFHSFNK